jgi:hypothetical protein
VSRDRIASMRLVFDVVEAPLRVDRPLTFPAFPTPLGRQEERKGEAKDELARDQERADAKAEEVANLERKTS